MSEVDAVTADETVPEVNAEDVADNATPEPKEPEASPEAPDPGKEKDAFLKKINKLTWQRREAERERDFYRQQHEQRQVKATEPDPVSDKPKTLADFEFDEGKYQTYLFGMVESRAVNAAENRLKQEQEKQSRGKVEADFRKRESAFSEAVDDYEEFAYAAPISNGVAEAIRFMDEGPAVAYYLGKHPEVAEQISSLPERAAGIQLGRLEAKLIAERERAKERPVSKTPPPPPKIDGVESGTEKDPAKMSDTEWDKYYERARKEKEMK